MSWYQNPDWWQVVITATAGFVAWRAFMADRDAVRVTQRADLWFHGVSIEPVVNPLTVDSVVKLHFKNFGPTRAGNVRINAHLVVLGVPSQTPAHPPLPVTAVAAGDIQSITLAPLGASWDAATIAKVSRGDIALRFDASVSYTDVFSKDHVTEFGGRYYAPARGGFIMDTNAVAD